MNWRKNLNGSTCAEGYNELISYLGRSKKAYLLKPTDKLNLVNILMGMLY